MTPSVKTALVTALRSGNFKKAKYQLRDCDSHYDPAGILCELAVDAGIIPAAKDLTQKTGREDAIFFGYTYENRATGIPDAVAKWADVSYRSMYNLCLKSDHGMTFDQVADYIEEKF